MILNNKKLKTGLLLLTASLFFITSCNKDVQQFPEIIPTPPTGITIGETVKATADDSLFYKLILRSGLLATLNNPNATYTLYVTGNAGMRQFVNVASGGQIPVAAPDAVHAGFISTLLPAASAAGIVSYNISPQKLLAAAIPTTFPNLQFPSILNPAPQISALLRLTNFPSRRTNGAWLNAFPIKSTDMLAANGVIHHTAALVTPPQKFLWDTINTGPQFALLKASIQRADADPTAPGALQAALLNIGANLTLLAPDTTAFKNALSALSGGAIAATSPNAVFIGFINTLPITTVKGIVVYHILGTRAFSVNFPTTSTLVKTLLNGAVPTHPGVALQATFVDVPGFGMVAATATVKGAANATPANVTAKDNHFLNGVIHTIDQVLLPQ